MFFQRYYLNCLSHASYMIADEETGVAAVIDPQRDVDQYLEDAAAHGFQIRYVLLTHFHADFVAGHIELRDKTGANIYLGARADAEYEFTPVKDGDVVEFGRVRLKVLETPGHTPEGISILVFDLRQSDRKPEAVLTGDTLFIGDVGRPDLLASVGVTAGELANMLYDSLHDKLLALPDETKVYPAHGAGSMCGKQLSNETESTMGQQRRYNYALQPMSRDEFVQLVTADLPPAPAYFAYDAELNRKERANLESQMHKALQPLSLQATLKLQEQGAQVVDTRDPAEFAGVHLRGSLNIGLDGKYANWAGSLLDKSQPIVVMADSGREEESIMRLGRIGFDHVAGYLQGGPEALEGHPELQQRIVRITVQALADALRDDDAPVVVDVRTPAEYEQGHLEGAVHLPLSELRARLHELPTQRPLAIHCQGGYRSSIACSLLLQQPAYANVMDVVGGFNAWKASKLPLAEKTIPMNANG